MRRLIPLAAIIALALAPAVAADDFEASDTVAVSDEAATPIVGNTCDDYPGQEAAGFGSDVFLNSEVEPWVATDPGEPDHLVGAWQQDRWNDGGARGLVTAYSDDGGATWSTPNTTTFSSLCTGGDETNGGDFERATDPWVTISPDGTVYLMSLSLNNPNTSADHAMLVMKSPDGGVTWDEPITLIREDLPAVLNDKNSMTADPNDSDFVYAVWDRLEFPNAHARAAAVENAFPFKGPIWFSRTTDGGATWEPAREIFKSKGSITQTIGNQIVVLPDFDDGVFEGQVLDFFTYRTLKMGGNVFGFDNLALIRSGDEGATWTKNAIIVNKIFSAPEVDPDTGDPIRAAGIIADVAVDPDNGMLYAVWEDSRFTGFSFNQVVFTQSDDGGFTWTTPIRINKTPATGDLNSQALLPQVHVLPDGTVGVTYFDFRGNSAATSELETIYFLAHCHAAVADCTDYADWSDSPINYPEFDLRQAPIARGYFLGDYDGLTNTIQDSTDGFSAFFAMSNSASDPATIYSSFVAPAP